LADHRGKLSGYNYVKLQPVFTKEFLANYWFHLKKIAQFEYVSSVTIDDHEYEEKTVIGFDSIKHSVCEFCESRIHLCLTGFLLNANKLAKEDEIEERIKFMLVLLFVAFWVADKKDECPN
uniref:Recombination activating protein 1 n=1 Tax=Panagrolaimus sp. ES5 TaxID=591445 RepID=A0AC34GMA8_9BILA